MCGGFEVGVGETEGGEEGGVDFVAEGGGKGEEAGCDHSYFLGVLGVWVWGGEGWGRERLGCIIV